MDLGVVIVSCGVNLSKRSLSDWFSKVWVCLDDGLSKEERLILGL